MSNNNTIGPFSFIRLSPLNVPRRRLQIESRAGVDGVSVWDTGERSPTIEVATLTNVATVADADQLFLSYLALTDFPPVQARRAGVLSPYWFQVLDVEPTDVAAVLFSIRGGAPYYGRLAARWRLQPLNPARQQIAAQPS